MEWLEIIGWTQGQTPIHVQLFRVLMAAACGGIIGFEREAHNREAGLRTHILIATSAALFTSISFEIFYALRDSGHTSADPLRAVEAVTAGVAFLGAGSIFRMGANIKGLTTGAGMWLSGAVGFACACGYYALALLATALAVMVLVFLSPVSERVGKNSEDSTPASKER